MRDFNYDAMFLLMVPILAAFLATEREGIPRSLIEIESTGILEYLGPRHPNRFQKAWELTYERGNIAAQVGGALLGLLISWLNYREWCSHSGWGTWLVSDDGVISWSALFELIIQIPLFVTLVTVYVCRSVLHFLMFNDVVRRSHVGVRVFHFDNAGGLRAIARVGLRNQYVLACGGINIVAFAVVTFYLMEGKQDTSGMVKQLCWCVVAYLLLGPLVFLAPLVPFRGSMLRARDSLLQSIDAALHTLMIRNIEELRSGTKVGGELFQEIKRARALRKLVLQAPVWPFDVVTVRHFVGAYLVPLITGVATLPLKPFLSGVMDWVR